MQRKILAGLVFIALLAPAAGVKAASQKLLDDCASSDAKISMAACTTIIKDKKQTKENREFAYVTRSIVYQGKDDYERSVADASEALKLNPNDAYAFNARCVSYNALGEYARAIADCTEAMRLDPKLLEARSHRAVAHVNNGDNDDGIADLDEVIRLRPDTTTAYIDRGEAHINKGDADRGIADLNRALLLKPEKSDEAYAHYQLGLAYKAKGDVERVITELDQAVNLDPPFPLALAVRSQAYAAKGDRQHAKADLDAALKSDSTPESAWMKKEIAAAQEKARQQLAALDNGPAAPAAAAPKASNAAPGVDKALSDACGGQDNDRAIAACTTIIGSAQDADALTNARINRGLAHMRKNEVDPAIGDFSEAIKLAPGAAIPVVEATIAHNARGYAYNQKGDYDQALADLNEAIHLSERYAPAYANRGDAFKNKGQYADAVADYTRAMELDSSITSLLAPRAFAYLNVGNYDGAAADLTRVIALNPNDANPYLWRSVVHEKAGKRDLAISDVETALKISPDNSTAKQRLSELRAAPAGEAPAPPPTPAPASPPVSPSQVATAPANAAPPESVVQAPAAPVSIAAAPSVGKRVALVIGNSAYQNIGRLDNPANDAKLIAAALTEVGFGLIGGGAQLDLDKAGLEKAVREFGNQLRGADVGLFYYAGHGMQVRGANYLVPVSANPTKDADVDFELLDANLVLRQMEDAGTRLNLVMLDACRNNPFGGRGLRAASGGLAEMHAPSGTFISYATQPGNVAQDGSDGDSPYSKALSEVIRRPGLGLFDTFNEVALAVKKATGGAQEPWSEHSAIEGSFFFKPAS